jgi:purine-nucleoside phosphorylase
LEYDLKTKVVEATKFIQELDARIPTVGIILGSGMGCLINALKELTTISIADIPHFPQSTISFHEGNIVIGEWNTKKIVVQQGRFHFYEGIPMQLVALPVRVFHQLGVRTLIITNAAGSICKEIPCGSIVLIKDHINLMGANPLIGQYNTFLGERFPDMTEAYDPVLRDIVYHMHNPKAKVIEAVYAAIPGPSIPTSAENLMFRTLGADIVGMSTIPEVLTARQLNMKVLAFSVITDQTLPGKFSEITPRQVKSVTLQNIKSLETLIHGVLKHLQS